MIFRDAGTCLDDVVRVASDIVAADDTDIIMGSHISAVRVALRRVVAGRIPYIYTPVYEGGEKTSGVMAIGETPGNLSRPAIEWMARPSARRDVFDRQRLRLALALAQGDQEIHRRFRWPRGR